MTPAERARAALKGFPEITRVFKEDQIIASLEDQPRWSAPFVARWLAEPATATRHDMLTGLERALSIVRQGNCRGRLRFEKQLRSDHSDEGNFRAYLAHLQLCEHILRRHEQVRIQLEAKVPNGESRSDLLIEAPDGHRAWIEIYSRQETLFYLRLLDALVCILFEHVYAHRRPTNWVLQPECPHKITMCEAQAEAKISAVVHAGQEFLAQAPAELHKEMVLFQDAEIRLTARPIHQNEPRGPAVKEEGMVPVESFCDLQARLQYEAEAKDCRDQFPQDEFAVFAVDWSLLAPGGQCAFDPLHPEYSLLRDIEWKFPASVDMMLGFIFELPAKEHPYALEPLYFSNFRDSDTHNRWTRVIVGQ